jgi:CDGSH-type Zn-finger protein
MSQPSCVQISPCEVELEKGKPYFWCTCGLSQKRPFCDGSHKTLIEQNDF